MNSCSRHSERNEKKPARAQRCVSTGRADRPPAVPPVTASEISADVGNPANTGYHGRLLASDPAVENTVTVGDNGPPSQTPPATSPALSASADAVADATQSSTVSAPPRTGVRTAMATVVVGGRAGAFWRVKRRVQNFRGNMIGLSGTDHAACHRVHPTQKPISTLPSATAPAVAPRISVSPSSSTIKHTNDPIVYQVLGLARGERGGETDGERTTTTLWPATGDRRRGTRRKCGVNTMARGAQNMT